MTHRIEFDLETGERKVIEYTPEEEAAHAAAVAANEAAANSPAAHNARIDAQIDALERQALLPRITRDMHRMATLKAAAELGITEADLLNKDSPHYSPGYAKFKAFDDQLAALRAQRV